MKTLLSIYLCLGVFYFIVIAKEKLPHILNHSPTRAAKAISVLSLFGFSVIAGGFMLMKGVVYVIKQTLQVYKAYRALKKFNKRNKK